MCCELHVETDLEIYGSTIGVWNFHEIDHDHDDHEHDHDHDDHDDDYNDDDDDDDNDDDNGDDGGVDDEDEDDGGDFGQNCDTSNEILTFSMPIDNNCDTSNEILTISSKSVTRVKACIVSSDRGHGIQRCDPRYNNKVSVNRWFILAWNRMVSDRLWPIVQFSQEL